LLSLAPVKRHGPCFEQFQFGGVSGLFEGHLEWCLAVEPYGHFQGGQVDYRARPLPAVDQTFGGETHQRLPKCWPADPELLGKRRFAPHQRSFIRRVAPHRAQPLR
jgi:hypothetical protein